MTKAVWLVDSMTHEKVVQVEPSAFTWARARNAGRSGRATFQLGDPDTPEELNRDDVWPLKHWLVVEENEKVLFAGLILEADYDWGSKALDMTCSDIWWFWPRRHVIAANDATVASTHIDYTAQTPQNMVKRAVQVGTSGTIALNYSLPIVLPADTGPGAITRTIYGYHLESVQDVLDDMIKMDGGVNVDFRPRWSASDTLEWVLEMEPRTEVFEFVLSVPDSDVTSLKYRVDGSASSNRVYALGEGSEKNMLVATAAHLASVYPAVERTVELKSTTTLAQLGDQAWGELWSEHRPVDQIDMKINGAGNYKATDLLLGATVRWSVDKDPYIKDGFQEWELIEFSGSLTDEVSLAFSPKE